MPVQQTLSGSRNATWAPPLAYTYTGAALPLAGGHIAMQLRLYGAAAGDALLTLNPIDFTDVLTSGTAGAPDEVRTLTLLPHIEPGDPANPGSRDWASVTAAGEPGDSLVMAFDIRITYADGITEVLSSGTFILSPGVTTV